MNNLSAAENGKELAGSTESALTGVEITPAQYGYVCVHVEPGYHKAHFGDVIFLNQEDAVNGEGYYRVRKVQGGWTVDDDESALYFPKQDQGRFIADEDVKVKA